MVVHVPDSGFSSISVASSSELAITPISITHIASESVVQRQQQRLAPHKQPFSNWADGVARHTGATFAHPSKHHPCANSMQQRAAPQPRAQEVTAGHNAGGNTIEIYTPQQDRKKKVAAHKHTYTYVV